jgi:hypothetical protein
MDCAIWVSVGSVLVGSFVWISGILVGGIAIIGDMASHLRVVSAGGYGGNSFIRNRGYVYRLSFSVNSDPAWISSPRDSNTNYVS